MFLEWEPSPQGTGGGGGGGGGGAPRSLSPCPLPGGSYGLPACSTAACIAGGQVIAGRHGGHIGQIQAPAKLLGSAGWFTICAISSPVAEGLAAGAVLDTRHRHGQPPNSAHQPPGPDKGRELPSPLMLVLVGTGRLAPSPADRQRPCPCHCQFLSSAARSRS